MYRRDRVTEIKLTTNRIGQGFRKLLNQAATSAALLVSRSFPQQYPSYRHHVYCMRHPVGPRYRSVSQTFVLIPDSSEREESG